MSLNTEDTIVALSWQSFAYGIGVFGKSIVSYLTLPLFTNFMPQAEYGVVSVLTANLILINTLTNAGLPSATFRIYNDTSDSKNRQSILGSSLLLFTLFALIPAILFLFTARSLSQLVLGEAAYSEAFKLVGLLMFIETLINYGYILLRIQVRPLATSLHYLLLIIIQVGAALVFVRLLNLGASGYFLGYICGGLLGLVVMALLVRGMLYLQLSRKYIKELMAFGMPLLPATLSMWALRLADRSLVVFFAGLNQAAIYEIGYKIGSIAGLFISPFVNAWVPYSFSVMNKPNAAGIYRDVLTYIATGCTFLALVVIGFQSELVHLVAPITYQEAVRVVPWVALAQIALGIYPVINIGPKIAKRTQLLAWTALVAAFINIAVNLVLIPRIGFLGAAISSLGGYFILIILTGVVSQRAYKLPLDWVRLGKLTIACIGELLIIIYIGGLNIPNWQSVLLRMFVLMLFPIILLFQKFVTVSQLNILWRTGIGFIREGKLHKMDM